MRKLLRKIVLFLPIFIVMFGINILADPAHIFRDGYEEEAAKLILNGQNVVGMTNYNERFFQQNVALGNTNPLNTIIVGSSRVMVLSDDVIPSMGAYRNTGMSGAGVYDYMGLLGLYYSKGELPNKVILGLDPWILNVNNGETRYQALQPYIDCFEQIIHGEIPQQDNIASTGQTSTAKLQVFSPSYFQSSVKYAIAHPKALIPSRSFDFYGTIERDVSDSIRYIDGSIEYDLRTRNTSVQEANASAKSYVSGRVYQMEKFDTLSIEYSDIFISMVDYLQSQNIEVVFFLPPFHPYVYHYLSTNANYSSVAKAEKFFRDIAKERNIEVFGSYDPAKLSCGEECFFDGMHMKRSHIAEAWKKV